MKELGAETCIEAFGKTISALSQGFEGGDSKCLPWIEYNIKEHFERVTPETAKFMVGMKTMQMKMMVEKYYA